MDTIWNNENTLFHDVSLVLKKLKTTESVLLFWSLQQNISWGTRWSKSMRNYVDTEKAQIRASRQITAERCLLNKLVVYGVNNLQCPVLKLTVVRQGWRLKQCVVIMKRRMSRGSEYRRYWSLLETWIKYFLLMLYLLKVVNFHGRIW